MGILAFCIRTKETWGDVGRADAKTMDDHMNELGYGEGYFRRSKGRWEVRDELSSLFQFFPTRADSLTLFHVHSARDITLDPHQSLRFLV